MDEKDLDGGKKHFPSEVSSDVWCHWLLPGIYVFP